VIEYLDMNKNDIAVDYNKLFPNEPSDIFNEILKILDAIYPDFTGEEVEILKDAFWDTVRLFKGQYPGYKACNTPYHDLEHSLTVSLSTTRLIDGAIIAGKKITPTTGSLGIIAALFHDVGLIQTIEDDEGTGAKYTIVHEERSIEFMKNYLRRKHFPNEYIELSSQIIACTMMNLETSKINFKTGEVELIGKILGTADLYTQLADRLYLEKLLYLYREFQEGGINRFDSEYDLLKSTEDFYKNIAFKRFDDELSRVYKYMKLHFKERWGVNRDYYREGIDKNIEYLTNVVLKYRDDYKKMLRRASITMKLDKDS